VELSGTPLPPFWVPQGMNVKDTQSGVPNAMIAIEEILFTSLQRSTSNWTDHFIEEIPSRMLFATHVFVLLGGRSFVSNTEVLL